MVLLPLDLFWGIVRALVSSTKISSEIKNGTAFYLPHPDGVILNGMCVIGDNVSIYQQVTIGEWWGAAPCIKNGTSIFAGAKVFGGITIGGNCKIGANTVINVDIPDNSSVSVQSVVIRSRSIENSIPNPD
ncbi:hypothetical protein AU255_03845 [Methyloprofundus sedimenti]|uniref:Serine acetyltransferase n=1 Tax=Methyloprofundus sedimenti TaxID=1420851 RepID=A0A1V8M621_9GAMM|nr:hypothetical protein [Methyloprofundus sedimenti]OQK17040.1 hypothetical protein AU255_03845 [Methyloprofundus sedimenti]